LQVYDDFKIPGVMNINGVAIQAYPDIVKACLDRKWEFIGHGYTQRNMQKVENERADIRKSAEVLERVTGKRPRGWLARAGPHRDMGDGGYPQRGRLRLRRRLGDRRSAGVAEDAQQADPQHPLHAGV
jgi:peptidoglycan/xylan/chitin deacetylase (PgdA/CDA1 family)